ncbi:dihydroxyacid dehydratase/phosphogluconate dehydratase [Candidatus Scalindua japonica]|uniref:Dihydroxyacid dehydratase/phosphogluconate dehydratase n=1 Tax=Candidatus Scalindua japonica TaxID=1284222 RepID=A0A286TY07_9BACT|nr:DUF1566 domain-containing protein [Candidatus Scalindua japonica]GAX60701.1 dihydroxyacid dehydratase/phosphogluconate dehydratase [Candidatus Scalindua japonica]
MDILTRERKSNYLAANTHANQHNLKTQRLKLRSSYENCTKEDIERILKKYNFFNRFRNETRNFSNDFELKTINRDKVVIDHTTKLIWHQSGSLEKMDLNKEWNWKEKLNQNEYAGYSDWRLPTAAEAASLLKSKNKNTDLFIDPVFDEQQKSIWTCDHYSAHSVWCVNFSTGCVRNYNIYYGHYSRPVRSFY